MQDRSQAESTKPYKQSKNMERHIIENGSEDKKKPILQKASHTLLIVHLITPH